MAAEELFYICDSRQVVGNCALWWRQGGAGYTCDLGDAGLYSRDGAHSHRETDIAVPRELAERLAVRHVRLDQLRAALEQTTPEDER